MKKRRILLSLTMVLILLCGNTLTAFASEFEKETQFEMNLAKYFTFTNDMSAYGDSGIEAVPYSVVHFKTSEPAYMGLFNESRTDIDYKYCNLIVISETPNIKYDTYATNCEEKYLESELAKDFDLDCCLSTPVVLDGKTYYYTILSFSLRGAYNVNLPLWSLPQGAGIGNVKNWQDIFGNEIADAELENKPPVSEYDETFAFIDFKSNEYISATWNGTTFDSKSEKFDSMGFEVTAIYAYANSLQIATTDIIVENGNLSSNNWSKKQDTLRHEDDNLYLRAVSFTPYYKQFGQTCRGKTETIWLKDDGSKDYLPNEELTMIEDSSFYLRGVSVDSSLLGVVDGDVRSHISWTGTTRDDMICKVPLDKTYADLLCLCYTPTYKITFVDLYELDTNFMGGKPLPLRKALDDATQSFYINYSAIDEAANSRGLIFAGKIYITPYFFYEADNAIYKGAVTVVDILNNELEKNPDTGDILVPDISASPTPSATPSGDSNTGGVLDDNMTFEKALPTFWQMLKTLWSSMGAFPSLMYSLFPYLPKEFYTFMGIFLIGVIIFRFIGR